jgi:ADP-L-glycero-D-manno-heptose 6-epimerase
LFEALGVPGKVEYITMPSDLNGKYQNYTCADMKKTQKILGKAAVCTPLKAAVKDYVTQYLLPKKSW